MRRMQLALRCEQKSDIEKSLGDKPIEKEKFAKVVLLKSFCFPVILKLTNNRRVEAGLSMVLEVLSVPP